jgi:uncharacterized protein YbjT (DUF2867 family)
LRSRENRGLNVLLFGATGVVGQGVLRECLLDGNVRLVQTVGRNATGIANAKLKEVLHADLWNLHSIESRLIGFEACFFCLGVSSAGLKAEEYERVTYGLTMAVASTLARLNPQMTFVYVSGAGTDSSEKGSSTWARVKGRTENALLRLPFKAAYMFRPGIIVPLDGIRSKTTWYRLFYLFSKPVLPPLRRLFPNLILTTQQIGRAMLAVVRRGAPKKILESKDIRVLAD